MSLNAAALEILVSKGLTAEDIVAVARALETTQKRSGGAVRQARYRERKSVTSDVTGDVTCDVTAPPKEYISNPPVLFANANSDSEFWASAKSFLSAKSKNPGALVNKWLRENGKELTVAAINAAQLERAVDPVAYVGGYFRRHSQAQAPPVWDGMP